MTPIRVLHVVGIMNMGGLETLIMNIYRNIDRNKIQFDFLVHKEEEGIYDKEIKTLGGNIYKIPYVNKVGPIKYPKILSDFFKNNKQYKIVHSHMNLVSGIILKEAKKAGIPYTIAHAHNINDIGKMYEIIYKRLVGMNINRYSDYKFACSLEAASYIFGKKYSNQVKIIKNGIDLSKFKIDQSKVENVKKELGISEDAFIIGNVARFSEQKNHKFLIDIFRDIVAKKNNSVLVLVGDGKLKAEIYEKIKKYGIEDKVIFTGIRNDIPIMMNLFDVFLFPSLFEGLGIVLIEAQSAGTKCVVSTEVPKEADMNIGLVEFRDLDEPIGNWTNEILKKYNKRYDSLNLIKEQGYDINETVDYIQEFYLKLCR